MDSKYGSCVPSVVQPTQRTLYTQMLKNTNVQPCWKLKAKFEDIFTYVYGYLYIGRYRKVSFWDTWVLLQI